MTIGDTPSPRFGHFASISDNHLFIHGGIDSKGEILSDTYLLDLEHGVWRRCMATEASKPCSMPLAFGTAAFHGTKMFLNGGTPALKSSNSFSAFELDTAQIRHLPKELNEVIVNAKRRKKVLIAHRPDTEFDITHWTTDDVLAWLDILELPMYKKHFTKEKVDGTRLLTVTDAFLKEELKMKFPHRKKILSMVENFRVKLLTKLKDGRLDKAA